MRNQIIYTYKRHINVNVRPYFCDQSNYIEIVKKKQIQNQIILHPLEQHIKYERNIDECGTVMIYNKIYTQA